MRKMLLALLLASCAGCHPKTDVNASTENMTEDQVQARQASAVDLLKAGDGSVCGDRLIQFQIVNSIIKPGMYQREDFDRYVSKGGQFPPFKGVSMSGKNPDIAEVSCTGNLVLNGDTFLINYKLRPDVNGMGITDQWEIPPPADPTMVYGSLDQVVIKGLRDMGMPSERDYELHQQEEAANAAANASNPEANSAPPETFNAM